MNFKSKDTEFSAKITLGTARKLKEANIIDLLDSESYADLSEILSNPLKSLDLLWEIVKDQAEAVPMTKIEFEDNLELGEGLKALIGGVENFIHQLGEASFQRYSGIQRHTKAIMNHQIEVMETMIDDPKVKGMIQGIKDEAIQDMMDGIKSKKFAEN